MARVVPDLSGVVPPKKVERANILVEKPAVGRAFSLSNLLSAEECSFIISNALKLEQAEPTLPTYSKYLNHPHGLTANCTVRNLIRARFVNELYSRIRSHLQANDFEDNSMYKKSKEEIWQPIGISEIMMFSATTENHFYPITHERNLPKIADCVRALSVIIYLNDDYVGEKPKLAFYGPEYQKLYMACGFPKTGTALLISNTLRHAQLKIDKGVKYTLRADLVVQRTDILFPPPRLFAFKYDPLPVQLAELAKLNKTLPTNDISGKTAVSLQILKIRMEYRAFPTAKPGQHKDDVTFHVPADIFARILRQLDLKLIIRCSEVSRHWHKMVQHNSLWILKFTQKALEKIHLFNYFSKGGELSTVDWYQEYKTMHLRQKAQNACACFDLDFWYSGAFVLKAAISTHEDMEFVMTQNATICEKLVTNWDALWVVFDRMYEHMKYDLKTPVTSQAFPVLLAEGHILFDRSLLGYLMFSVLQVPSLCVINSALLALYSVERTTGVAVEFGYLFTVVTPVWRGEVLRNKVKIYNAGGVSIGNHYASAKQFYDSSLIQDFDFSHQSTGYKSLFSCVYSTILECDKENQKDLFNCILLCGEMPHGEFREQIQKGFEATIKEPHRVICPKTPEFAVLRGAFAFSQSSKFIEMSQTRAEYCLSPNAYTNPIVAPADFY